MRTTDFIKAKDLLKSLPDKFRIHLNSAGYIFDCSLNCDICPFARDKDCDISDTDTLTQRQLNNVKQLFPEQFI